MHLKSVKGRLCEVTCIIAHARDGAVMPGKFCLRKSWVLHMIYICMRHALEMVATQLAQVLGPADIACIRNGGFRLSPVMLRSMLWTRMR
jgi:hypothetical protein